MNKQILVIPVLALFVGGASAQTAITGFESGLPSGWTTTGTAWTVGGTASGISAPEGSQLARSGAPNVSSGSLAESLTGTLTSSALTVTHSDLEWLATGWSGDPYYYGQGTSGLNRFEILDAALNVIATIAAPQSDGWALDHVNLLDIGLRAGGTFYFRAVDASQDSGYAWLAVDNIHFAGQALQVSSVPEPNSWALALTGLFFGTRRLKKTTAKS